MFAYFPPNRRWRKINKIRWGNLLYLGFSRPRLKKIFSIISKKILMLTAMSLEKFLNNSLMENFYKGNLVSFERGEKGDNHKAYIDLWYLRITKLIVIQIVTIISLHTAPDTFLNKHWFFGAIFDFLVCKHLLTYRCFAFCRHCGVDN